MGQRLGIIAGAGQIPFFICEKAQEQGYRCVVAGIRREAEDSLEKTVKVLEWFDIQDISRLINFFQKNGVKEAVFAGKIGHRTIYGGKELRMILSSLQNNLKDRRPTALIEAVFRFFSQHGITIKDPTPFIASSFCDPGVLTLEQLSPEVEEDIKFGWSLAKKLADSDIGQTLIIKEKAVVAVEGMEGTDEAIKRGGELAGEGVVAVKVSRSSQDPRIDLPAVGLSTIESLCQVRGKALGFEAGKVAFFQKKDAVSFANEHGLSIVVKE
jgi:hypothetical protein